MTDAVITSTANPLVREAAALAEAAARRRTGRHLAEGPRVVAEALRAGLAERVLVGEDVPLATDAALAAALDASAAEVVRLGERALARVATTVTPTGPVAVVRTPALDAALPPRGAVLVLDALADPGNVGTLVRAADAAGAAAVVVLGDGADPFSPKAVRASAGSCYHLPVLVRRDRVTGLAELALGRELHGLAADASTSVFDAVVPEDLALVVGNEARGLDPATRGALTGTVAVPMRGGAESLNAALAGAIALFAVLARGGAARIGAGAGLGSPASPEEAS